MELAPRPAYGVAEPELRQVAGGLRATGEGTSLLLSSSVPFVIADGVARAAVSLRAGESLDLRAPVPA